MGSSVGERQAKLEQAALALKEISSNQKIRFSPIYETPALLPEGAPESWNVPYLNLVAEIEWSGPPTELLKMLKQVEVSLGRVQAPRWAPRVLDLDVLLFGNEVLNQENLKVPHPGLSTRSFQLDPLKDLTASICIPGHSKSVATEARALETHRCLVMGIVNLTPDSFSDGRMHESTASIEATIRRMDSLGVQYIDLGAESTRPGATLVSTEEEWRRLEPALTFWRSHFEGVSLRTKLSIDTTKAKIAERALFYGVDCINDVSGLSDPEMLPLLKEHDCDFVLMHSLSVPADQSVTFRDEVDPIAELKQWLQQKLEMLDHHKIRLERVIFDPGIGFGKTPKQAAQILERIDEFKELPIRILVGHSRKSFLQMGEKHLRDQATLSWSLKLARNVDVLRVHDVESHVRAFT